MKEIEGFEEFVRVCTNVAERLEGPELAKAVKKGARIVQKAIQTQAPVKSGDLRESLKMVKERAKVRGKAVYQVVPDPDMNAVFQKPIKNPVRSKSRYAYYPASQEYGYFTRRPGGGMTYIQGNGSKVTMDKVPGKHYMRTGAEVASAAAKETIAKSLLESIEKGYGG